MIIPITPIHRMLTTLELPMMTPEVITPGTMLTLVAFPTAIRLTTIKVLTAISHSHIKESELVEGHASTSGPERLKGQTDCSGRNNLP